MFGKPERLYADARANEEYKESEKEVKERPRLRPEPRVEPKPEPRAELVAQTGGSTVRAVISNILELAGVTAVSVGGFLVAPWLGCMMLGVLLIVLGVATGYGA